MTLELRAAEPTTEPDAPVVLEAHGLTKSYPSGDGSTLHILRDLHLTVHRGEMVAIVGASGAGKSTLLHLLGALDSPTAGEVILAGTPIGRRSEAELAAIRNRQVGFVFQFHHLLREFTALENVMIPQRILGTRTADARARATMLLVRLGLGERMNHRPSELSGGEQQRTAVARALATSPAVLLADEPTGNLDYRNGDLLHDVLAELARDMGMGMVVVTHNHSLADRADRVLLLSQGQLTETDVRGGMY